MRGTTGLERNWVPDPDLLGGIPCGISSNPGGWSGGLGAWPHPSLGRLGAVGCRHLLAELGLFPGRLLAPEMKG